MIVLLMHAGLSIVPGDGGVVMFFCISGYVITAVLIRERDRTGGFDPVGFYARRFLKLLPPLVAVLLIPTIVYATLHDVSWAAVIAQFGFSYNWVLAFAPDAAERVLPGSDVVWSLAIEEQFYLVFGLIWLLLVRRRRWQLLTVVVAAAALVGSFLTRVVISWGQPANPDDWDPQALAHVLRGTDARIEAIALGMLVAIAADAQARRRLVVVRLAASDAALLIAIVALPLSSILLRGDASELVLRPTVQALVAAVIILYGLFSADTRLRRLFDAVCGAALIQRIGLASYSIYLVHQPVFSALSPVKEVVPGLVLLPVAVVVGVSAGLVLYRCVEVPALGIKERYFATNLSATSR